MGIDINVDLQGLDKVERALRMMSERSVRLKPLMRDLGHLMMHSVDRNFEAEGRPSKWKARSPITQASLAMGAQGRAKNTKRYQNAGAKGKASILRRESLKAMGNKILSRSGDLKKAISMETSDTEVAVGPARNMPYARIHQLGGVIRPKNAKALLVPCGGRILRLKSVTIPARPYLVIPPEDMLAMALATKDFMGRLVRA